MSKRQNIAMPIEDWLIFKRLKNHFRKYVRSVSVVSKHLLWHAVVHPNMSGSWMLRMQLENDWLTYRYPLIPMVEPEQIIPNIDKQKICLSKCLSKDVSGLSPRELIFICALVNCLKPKTIFEFGTSLGRTTYNLSINSPKDTVIYTLDLSPAGPHTSQKMTEYEPCFNEEHMILNDRTRAIFNKEPEEVKIKRIFSDSAKFEVDSLRQKIDFIFIDGSHSYKYVQNDSEKAFEMLRKGGTIVWHDFTDGHQWPDVNRHLKELAKKKKLMRVSDTKFAVYRDGI